MSRVPEWLRSVILTFVFTILVTVTAVDFDWSQAAVIAAFTAALRTAVSALLPGGSFGTGPVQGDE